MSVDNEMMERAKLAETAGELEALAAEEGTELSEEVLEGVAGGGPDWDDPRRPCNNKKDDLID